MKLGRAPATARIRGRRLGGLPAAARGSCVLGRFVMARAALSKPSSSSKPFVQTRFVRIPFVRTEFVRTAAGEGSPVPSGRPDIYL
jgi:hypothetical protein